MKTGVTTSVLFHAALLIIAIVGLGSAKPLAPEVVELRARQAIWIEPDVRVRYSNPYAEENEYFAVCLPAFAPDLAQRDDA